MSAEDELAIRNLLAKVAHLTDGWGSMDEYLPLWTEDCTWSSPHAGTWEGREGHLARQERYRRAGVQGPDVASFHLVTTQLVEVDGDRATSRSTWVLVNADDGGFRIQDVGTYDDELRRTPEGWQLARRQVNHASDGAWLREKTAALDAGGSG